MKNIFILAGNTLKILFRKKTNVVVYIILPILVVCGLMGVTASDKASNVYMGIVDNDNSNFSNDMLDFLKNTGKFSVEFVDEKEVNEKIASRNLDFAFIIPDSFEENIYNGKIETIKIVSIKGEQVTILIEEYTKFYLNNLQDIYIASKGSRELFDKIYYGYEDNFLKFNSQFVEDKVSNKQSTQISIGMFIMFMMIACSTTAGLILKEKRDRTFYRICAGPVKPREYVSSNVLVNILIVFIQIVSVLFVVEKIFKFETYVPVIQMLIILMSFGFAAVGIGMIIMLLSNSSFSSYALNSLIVIPTCMISGCFWPRSIMSKSLQKIGYFIPQTWAMDAITKIQMGNSFDKIRINILILWAFALVFFLIAIYKIKQNDDINIYV